MIRHRVHTGYQKKKKILEGGQVPGVGMGVGWGVQEGGVAMSLNLNFTQYGIGRVIRDLEG